jgi:hypothetical protein
MRKNGTKYPEIEKLPVSAKPVSMFADEIGVQVPQVYIMFDRYETGKRKAKPGYVIKQYQKTNYVIPD